MPNSLISFPVVYTLPPLPWIQDGDVRSVFTALSHQALFVGGCVRNAIIERDVQDIDLATPLTPPQVIRALERAGIAVLPTGIDHGTVTAVVNKKPFQITTLRTDIDTDGRHATVEFTTDWLDDAERRDFTINTLLADLQGNVYDPTRRGLDDLRQGRVIFVGDPETRIAEDYLRILRFFRFHALYGRGQPDEAALAACSRTAPFVFALSHERITQEFFKILDSDNVAQAIDLMQRAGILAYFNFPFATSEREDAGITPDCFVSLCAFQKFYKLPSLTPRLFVLANMEIDHLHKLETLLIVPKVFKKEMQTLAQIMALPDMEHENGIHFCVYKFGRHLTAQALMLQLAMGRVHNDDAPDVLDIITNWPIPEFPINGKDLLALEVKQGPNVGRILQVIEEWWIAEEFKPVRRDCLAKAQDFVKRRLREKKFSKISS